MKEFFDDDNIVKEYDSAIFKRILSYIKPYKLLLFLTFAALAVSTVGELLVPVLEQRLIDNAILSKYITINLLGAAAPGAQDMSLPPARTAQQVYADLSPQSKMFLDHLQSRKDIAAIGDRLFIAQDQKLRIRAAIERELRQAGILESEQWYVFKQYKGGVQTSMNNKSYNLNEMKDGIEIITEGTYSAIRNSDLKKLDTEMIAEIRSGDISRIKYVVAFLFLVLLLVFLATFVQTWSANLIGQQVMKSIRLDLFKKTIMQSTDFLSHHPVGRIVTRLTGDVETINEFFTSFLAALLKDIVLMLGVLATLFFLSPHLALVVLVLLPPVVICTNISRLKARDAFRQQRAASSAVTAYLSEHLAGLAVVQLFVRERLTKLEFAKRNKEFLDANIAEINVFATFRPIVEFFATLTTASLIAVGSSLVLNYTLSIGVLIAFINLVAMFYAPIMDISEKYTILQSAMAGGERVFKLLDTNEVILNTGTQKIAIPVKGNIVFNKVHFSYKKDEEILKGLDFSVDDGQTAAIVGYTGAGKSTVINVLSRLWDIDSGEILLNGKNIKTIPLQDLRKTILPVLQDVFLFSGTIKENISLGLNLSDEQITDAARAVNADDFIQKLPQGYDTVLSEGAANISSGQRQLLSFARVIAHNPAIVVLDEATSSIDSETEKLVQKGISTVLAGRTSIVIAHRLSTIKNADKILVLRGGKVVEQGRHNELVEQDGLYALLYRLQFSKTA